MVSLVERTAQLPLLDAAYYLWIWRTSLPAHRPSDHMVNGSTKMTFDNFKLILGRAIAVSDFERENAHQAGRTFDALKEAHPEASNQDLQNAIRSAIKFEHDCSRFFTWSKEGLVTDACRAVDLAKLENPAFQEATYSNAITELCKTHK